MQHIGVIIIYLSHIGIFARIFLFLDSLHIKVNFFSYNMSIILCYAVSPQPAVNGFGQNRGHTSFDQIQGYKRGKTNF